MAGKVAKKSIHRTGAEYAESEKTIIASGSSALSFENTGRMASASSRIPRLRHSNMECWNPGFSWMFPQASLRT